MQIKPILKQMFEKSIDFCIKKLYNSRIENKECRMWLSSHFPKESEVMWMLEEILIQLLIISFFVNVTLTIISFILIIKIVIITYKMNHISASH